MGGVASIEPTMQIHLISYGFSPQMAAAGFIIGTISYSMIMPLLNKFPAKWDKRILITVGLALASICQFLFGPTPGVFPRYCFNFKDLCVLTSY